MGDDPSWTGRLPDTAQRAAGSSAPACSAGWQFRHEISWIPLRRWHPAFLRAWWIGGQIGKYANDAYTAGIRICGLFVAVWWFLPNNMLTVSGGQEKTNGQ